MYIIMLPTMRVPMGGPVPSSQLIFSPFPSSQLNAIGMQKRRFLTFYGQKSWCQGSFPFPTMKFKTFSRLFPDRSSHFQDHPQIKFKTFSRLPLYPGFQCYSDDKIHYFFKTKIMIFMTKVYIICDLFLVTHLQSTQGHTIIIFSSEANFQDFFKTLCYFLAKFKTFSRS